MGAASETAARRAPYRFAQLPYRHGVMGTVVIAGDGVEVRQAVPILVAGADVQPQQAGFLVIPERTLRAQAGFRQRGDRVAGLEAIFNNLGAWPLA